MCICIMSAIACILTYFCINNASFLNVLVLQRSTIWINIFLKNILYCTKQICANINQLGRRFFSELNKKTAERESNSISGIKWVFRHFSTRHAIYPQFSSAVCHQWLNIKANMNLEKLIVLQTNQKFSQKKDNRSKSNT